MDNVICSNIVTKFGIVMSWIKLSRNNPMLNPILCHEINKHDHYCCTARHKSLLSKLCKNTDMVCWYDFGFIMPDI